MPRPKRLKAAPSVPEPCPPRASQPVVEIIAIPHGERAAYLDFCNASDTDEGAEAIVQPVVKRGRGRPKKRPLPAEDVSEPADGSSANGPVAPAAPVEESLLEDIDIESSSPSIEVGRRDRNSTTFESSFLSIANFRRRPRQPSILGRGPSRARSSSVESNQAEGSGRASMSSRNVSILSIGNFRRRPRQPSILGRNALHARSSSIGFDTDRGTPAQGTPAWRMGTVNRRLGGSSVLGSTQRPPQGLTDDYQDEEDFNPEDESTPLNLSKTAPMTTSSVSSTSNPRKRKLSTERELQPNPAVSSQTGFDENDSVVVDVPPSDQVTEDNDMPSSPPAVIPSIEAHDPEPINDTLAPPQSSSPPDSPMESSPVSRMPPRLPSHEYRLGGRRPLRGRSPAAAAADSPISSPPSLTHSPDRPVGGTVRATPKPRARWQQAPPSTFSTAQLQTLLPRRRRPLNRDPYEIASSDDEVDASGLASDDDELNNLSVVPQSRRPASLFIRRPAPLRKPAKPIAASKSRTEAAHGKNTYGSRANDICDKENDEYDLDHSLAPLPDDGDGDESVEKSHKLDNVKELKEAAKKFKEVDKWELEYEDVTASSSSPLGAR